MPRPEVLRRGKCHWSPVRAGVMVEAQKQTGSKEEIPPSLLLPSHFPLVPALGKTQTKPGGQRSSGIQSLVTAPQVTEQAGEWI